MNEPFKLTVLEVDLDKAIEKTHERIPIANTCILAQALRRQTNGVVTQIGFGFNVGGALYRVRSDTPAREIMRQFDNGYYDEIRQQLPVTLEIPMHYSIS